LQRGLGDIQEKMAQWYMEARTIVVEKGPVGTMLPATHNVGAILIVSWKGTHNAL
jgi:hypothetical protein